MQKNGLRLILCFMVLGSCQLARADEQTTQQGTQNRLYRQQVRNRLKTLQSSLDILFANHQLTQDQYQTESERIRQLRLQMHVDAQENESMTRDDRDTDFSLIRQIDQEVSQWAVANSSGAPVAQNAALADLQQQYAGLNQQYQGLDARYTAAVSARDLQTAQTIQTQMDALHNQMNDVRTKMQQQISAPANP